MRRKLSLIKDDFQADYESVYKLLQYFAAQCGEYQMDRLELYNGSLDARQISDAKRALDFKLINEAAELASLITAYFHGGADYPDMWLKERLKPQNREDL